MIGIGKQLRRPRPRDGRRGAGRAADVPHPQHRRRRPGRPRRDAAPDARSPLRGRAGRRHRQDRQGRPRRGRARTCVYGYTSPTTSRRATCRSSDGQWARAKGFDTFCPLGPWVETELDVSDLRLVTRLDGEVVQDGTTADMVHHVADLIAYASAAFTLLPGDVILTGTPSGVGPVTAGQRVSVEIEGIGTLDNPFVRR